MPPSAVGQRPADLILDETNGVIIEIRRWYKTAEVDVPDVYKRSCSRLAIHHQQYLLPSRFQIAPALDSPRTVGDISS